MRDPIDSSVELDLLEAKARHPAWGAKKLLAFLWGEEAPLCVRSADRILARHGLVRCRHAQAPVQRFERERPNELWQMDFKGVTRRLPYSPLSVIDDCTRFCLGLLPVAMHSGQEVWDALWGIFGEYGLPDAILTDNEGCFASPKGHGPSWLEARLWRLGVRTLQGRVAHPQTQGKVERFHRTIQEELGQAILQPTAEEARTVYGRYVLSYNWERPHEAIQMRVPGEVYLPSIRIRPARLPEARIEGECRKVDASGKFCYKSKRYRAGKGLIDEWVDIQGEEIFYAGVMIGPMSELRV